ncbi:MAG: alpha-L-fucosidase [Bryobacteraceae bacterium]|jgi:alpha-L-fucosidase
MRPAVVAAFAAWSCAVAAAQSYEQRLAETLKRVDEVAAQGPFQPDWKSLEKFQIPQWYADAKFGIFIHWGAYAVPAQGNEWYPRNMYQPGQPEFKYHAATYGPQSKFGYKDFIPKFRAEKFDPEAWAALFKKAGARFVMPVAEHHDGFPLYDCSFTDWSAVKMGPRRDLIGALAASVRKRGMVFAASSHRAEHWWFFDGGKAFDSDVRDPRYAGLYAPAQPRKAADGKTESQPDRAFLDDWLARTAELVDKYQPQVVWFDWWIEQPVFQPYLQRFAAYYYNRGAEWKRGVAINYKNKSFPEKAAVLDIERGKLDAVQPLVWQTDTSISLKSWGYIENDTFRTADSLVDDLVDIVSKNGLLLLNIGPRADGTIPEQARSILLEIGRWLAVNGEAIYGTRPWKVYGEGPTEVLKGGMTDAKQKVFTAQDVRFTQGRGNLYAVLLDWPGRPVTLRSITDANLDQRKVGSVHLLGGKGKLKWKQGADGLTVDLPAEKSGEYAFVLRISLR